jgi:hypothetical protein
VIKRSVLSIHGSRQGPPYRQRPISIPSAGLMAKRIQKLSEEYPWVSDKEESSRACFLRLFCQNETCPVCFVGYYYSERNISPRGAYICGFSLVK